MNAKKLIGTALSVVLCASMLAGCGNQKNETETTTEKGKKTLVIGDTTFNSSNEENNVNPHDSYSGWACIRYGIGETLVKYSDTMEIEPWLAKEWENVDELTWKITLQDNVKFSSGRDMDAEAVKECLEHLTENHERAKNDLKIESMEADGQILTIHTSEPKPALLNYLGDPYGCIIDVEAGFDDGIVAGTGPYIAVDCQSDDHLTLGFFQVSITVLVCDPVVYELCRGQFTDIHRFFQLRGSNYAFFCYLLYCIWYKQTCCSRNDSENQHTSYDFFLHSVTPLPFSLIILHNLFFFHRHISVSKPEKRCHALKHSIFLTSVLS